MPTRRQQRINELLLEELSLLVPNRLDDPRLMTVAITRVMATQDLGHAKVLYTCSGTPAECDESLEALNQAAGFLRGELAGLGLRRLPQLIFARDRDFESGQRVLDLLRHLESHESPTDHAPGADAGAEPDRGDGGPPAAANEE
jgi:ribosome-binding factor A